jgi:cytochrome c
MKMKAVAIAFLLAASLGPACASEGEALAQAKECFSCHAADKETIGPAFASVAKKYKGNERAEAMLVSTVMKGSPGAGGYHWGTKKMPSPSVRQSLSEEEATTLVRWILAM